MENWALARTSQESCPRGLPWRLTGCGLREKRAVGNECGEGCGIGGQRGKKMGERRGGGSGNREKTNVRWAGKRVTGCGVSEWRAAKQEGGGVGS